MANEFDPLDGLSPEDLEYLSMQRTAFARQKAVHDQFSGDESRAAAADAHRKQVMREHGVEPQQEGSLFAPSRTVASNGATPMFSVLRAEPDASEGAALPPTGERYAPDWKHMKEQIAPHDGIWVVSRHEFPAHTAFILGFFGKEGWDPPADALKESFEVIVKNGRVFRTDPEQGMPGEPWEALRDKYEIAVAALNVLAGSGDKETRIFAQETLGRICRPDGATPFDDLRLRIESLQEENTDLRCVLRRIVDIVGQKSFMDALNIIERHNNLFDLGERSMFLLTLKEAERCLKTEK